MLSHLARWSKNAGDQEIPRASVRRRTAGGMPTLAWA